MVNFLGKVIRFCMGQCSIAMEQARKLKVQVQDV